MTGYYLPIKATQGLMSKIKSFLIRRYSLILSVLIIILALVILRTAQNRYFHGDEFEHVHSAWYVENNRVPYLDFFENHNPLLWYLITPFFLILGNTTQILIFLRFLMFVFVLGIGFFTYRVAEQVSRSKETALISVLLMFSLLLFVEPAIDIRPDVPQVFFGLASFYFLIRYFQSPRDREMVFSGLAAAVAFLFTQKMIFLLFGLVLIFIYRLFRRQISFRSIFIYFVCFSLPVVLFIGGLIVSGALKDYLLLGWLFNSKFITSFSAWVTLKTFIIPNILFWLILPVSVIFLWFKKGINTEVKVVVFTGVFLFLTIFKVRHPYPQYFLPSLPFLSITVGCFLPYIFDRFQLDNFIRAIIIILLLSEPAVFLVKKSQEKNADQIARVDYVLLRTSDLDYVYDGSLEFNLFRRDLHYFWFHNRPGGGLSQYRRLAQNKYFGRYVNAENCKYDMCELIKTKKPKYILGFTYMQEKCGLKELYENTEFGKIKVRKDKIIGPERRE